MSDACIRGCAYPGDDETMPAVVGQLCDPCARTIRLALRAIPDLIGHTRDNDDGRLTPGRETTDTSRHAINSDPGSPSPAYDLAEDAQQWLLRTALAHADANNIRGRFHARVDGVPVITYAASNAAYIIDNLTWYATVIPKEIYDETTGWQRDLERRTGQDELIHRIKTPCSRCDQRTLIRRDGSNHVECRNQACRARWHEDDFEWFAHVTAG